MKEQLPFPFNTTARLSHGGLPLGVLRPEGAAPVFEVIEWDEASLARLAEDIACLRSPVRSRAQALAEIAAGEWDVTVRDIFSKRTFRDACDARFAACTALHNLFPMVRDRVIGAAFDRDRTWVLKAYRVVSDLCETSVPYREKFTRLEVQARLKFWPSEPSTPLTAP